MVEPHSSNFRVITINYWGVRIFRKFTVLKISKGKETKTSRSALSINTTPAENKENSSFPAVSYIKAAIKTEVTEATNTLTNDIQSLRTENDNLRKDIDKLSERLIKAESDNDALEQYTRKNSVRISGVPEDVNGENTDGIVLKIAEELNVPMSPDDIDRSHHVGKVDNRSRTVPGAGTRHRDIIVKFATYNAKQRLYMKRKDLRDIEERPNVFINDDLTKTRSKLLFDARSLVRVNKFKVKR